MDDDESKVETEAKPVVTKRVKQKRSRPGFSPEEIETRYQEHLRRIKQEVNEDAKYNI